MGSKRILGPKIPSGDIAPEIRGAALDSVKMVLQNLIMAWRQSKDVSKKLQIAKKYMSVQVANADLFEDDISRGVPDNEVWRNIKGFEGVYQISNHGNIKCLEGFFLKRKRGGGVVAIYKSERSRRAYGTHVDGYLLTSLWKRGSVTYISIHRLVGIYFVHNPHPRKYTHVLHKDNDPRNPYFKNLEWGTQKKNIQHAVSCGRWPKQLKGGGPLKLKPADAKEIRRLLSEGETLRSIGSRFGVSHHTVLAIKQNKIWANAI